MVNTSPCPPHPPLSQHGRIITNATWHSHQKQRMKTHVFRSSYIVDKWFLPSFPSHGPAPQVRWVVFCRLQHLQPNFAAKTPLGVAEPWDKTTKKGAIEQWKKGHWLVGGFIQLCGEKKINQWKDPRHREQLKKRPQAIDTSNFPPKSRLFWFNVFFGRFQRAYHGISILTIYPSWNVIAWCLLFLEMLNLKHEGLIVIVP